MSIPKCRLRQEKRCNFTGPKELVCGFHNRTVFAQSLRSVFDELVGLGTATDPMLVKSRQSETGPLLLPRSHEGPTRMLLFTIIPRKIMTTDTLISNSEDPEVIGSGQPLTGYELVADLMRRQDEVIAQLDSLNDRIESAIKRLDDDRKLEQQAGHSTDTEPNSADSLPEAA